MNTDSKICHLFLDLESTIVTDLVDGWHTGQIINLEKILALIEKFNPDKIGIFSFAIWNEEELKKFNQHLREEIERVLDRKLDIVLTVDDDIIPACCAVRKLLRSTVSFNDATEFWSKGETFRLFMRNQFGSTDNPPTSVILIDDVVWDESWHWPELNVSGQLINIINFNGE